MAYALGVDLGTTFTAAAIERDGRLQIVELGNRAATMPSVVFLRDDETILTGEAAVRRGATEPARVAREFKRRMGDTTPVIVGGSPFSVDALMTRVLADVVAAVSEREGAAPAAIAVAFPANWGQYKKDLLEQAFRRADLDRVTTITEPEAAAGYYASQERLEPGDTIAVYDLGGGTFDAAVLRSTADGFEFLGQPEGIERLGGIDFDEAVYRHVVDSLGGAIGDLDPADPVAQAAVARLRSECVAAKEALSSDTDVSIPVLLPNVQTEIRLTRAEFEGMIRPALADTIVVIQRAIRSAGITPEDLHAVLLVGGSSRVPLVGQIVSAELGRPVAVDVHPKHSVALGAALHAAEQLRTDVASAAVSPDVPIAAAAPHPAVEAPDVTTDVPAPLPPIIAAASEPVVVPEAPEPEARTADQPTVVEPAASATTRLGTQENGDDDPPRLVVVPNHHRRLLIGGSVVVIAAIAAAAIAWPRGDGDGVAANTTEPVVVQTTPDTEAPEVSVTAAHTEPVRTTATEATTTTTATTATTLPPGPCDAVTAPCVEIESLERAPDSVIVTWRPFNFTPDVNGIHPHIYWSNATAAQAGTNAPLEVRVGWEITQELVYTGVDVLLLANRPADAAGVCATPGDARLDPPHSVIDPEVVHCVDLP